MNKSVIKVGIIGAGFAARFHVDALKRVFSTSIKVIGAYARNSDKLQQFTEPRQIQAFHDVNALIDACDVLHVCTPPVTHEPLVIAILQKHKHAIVEKPFTGYFGDGGADFNGDTFPRQTGLEHTLASIRRMLDAERSSQGRIMYAENWVYAPAIQKAREILEKSGGQILWIHGEQSHSGSHSLAYGEWRLSGGGSMIGKGSHPIAAAIYLKHAEGRNRTGQPIRPKSISARTHAITRMDNYDNKGHLQTHYKDIEDLAMVHIVFEDGTVANLFASELVLGGVKNQLEINANNHRTVCNLGPNNAMQAYTPDEKYFKDLYVVEKTETKQGWSSISPDEGWFNGYQHEMDAFYRSVAFGEPIESNSSLAADVIATIYAGYVSAEQKGTEIAITTI